MIHGTTILAIRHRDQAVLAGDGQVTFGQTVVKHRARKIRRLYNDRVLAGFAGSAADSFALFARFESKLEQYPGQSRTLCCRARQGLAHRSRPQAAGSDAHRARPVLRCSCCPARAISSNLTMGSQASDPGGPFALAAAKALAHNTDLDARTIAEHAMRIASEICIYTNSTRRRSKNSELSAGPERADLSP